MSEFKNIAVIADKDPSAQEALAELVTRYGVEELPIMGCPTQADVVIALGGDGFMLHSLHQCMPKDIPIYGMNCGTIGFLMNEYDPDGLRERLCDARKTVLRPLKMRATTKTGEVHEALAINEVSLMRKSGQASKLRITIDDRVVLKELAADGILVSTPAGSSAYNLSVGGPILPLRSNLLALTPIAPYRPRRWRGALLPEKCKLVFEALNPTKRPINAAADFFEVEDVVKVEVEQDRETEITMLFDRGHSLEERILLEQFI